MNNQPSRYGEATRELRALTNGLTVAEEDTARAVILYELIGQVDQATLAEAIDRAKAVLELRREQAAAEAQR